MTKTKMVTVQTEDESSSGSVIKNLTGGKNEVLLIEVEGEKKVFKPVDGAVERRMKAQRGGVTRSMYAEREVLCYLVAEALNFDFVPKTLMGKVDDRIGTLQDYVHGQSGVELKEKMNMSGEELQRTYTALSRYLGLFEFFTGQMDRNTGNWIYVVAKPIWPYTRNSKIMLIDNAATFPVKVPRKHPLTPGWDLECMTTEIPKAAKEPFDIDWKPIGTLLLEHVSQQAVELAYVRWQMIQEKKHWYQLEQKR